MQPFPQITDKDVILLTGKEYLIDRIWMEEFGREIEYRYRAVPVQLIYLLRKYGPVIPQGFFVESIQETCGLVEEPENAKKTPEERKKLAEEAARKIIDETVALGLITRTKPALDQRYQLYRISGEQLVRRQII